MIWYFFFVLWQLDEWVLCRIYNKKGTIEKYNVKDQKSGELLEFHEHETKPEIKPYGHNMVPVAAEAPNDQLYMDTSDSGPKVHTDSSSSEHVVSPDVTCDKEVQSEAKWKEFGLGNDDDGLNYELNYAYNNMSMNMNMNMSMNNLSAEDPFASSVQYQMNQFSPWQDMFTFLQKPFWEERWVGEWW